MNSGATKGDNINISTNNNNNNNNNVSRDHQDRSHDQVAAGEPGRPPEPPEWPDEGQLFLRQVADGRVGEARGRRSRSTSACQLYSAAPVVRQVHSQPSDGPAAISIAVHDYDGNGGSGGGGGGGGNERLRANTESVETMGSSPSAGASRQGSASTTSEVNSYDDAASIAERLSQIVDEQEFLLINNRAAGAQHHHRADGGALTANSHSMGNLLIAIDGKLGGQRRGSRDEQQVGGSSAARGQLEARSASALAVNRLAERHSSVGAEPSPSPSAASLGTVSRLFIESPAEANEAIDSYGSGSQVAGPTESRTRHEPKQQQQQQQRQHQQHQQHLAATPRERTKSFAGQEAVRAHAALRERRNESSGCLLPERGNLRQLESSRQEQARVSARLRAESVSSGSGGGGCGTEGLMLNIRRSAWKLDEFEQTFKPSGGGEVQAPGGPGESGPLSDSLKVARNPLLSSIRRVVGQRAPARGEKPPPGNAGGQAAAAAAAATQPEGAITVNLNPANEWQQQQQQRTANMSLAGQKLGASNKWRPSGYSGNSQIIEQQQQQQHLQPSLEQVHAQTGNGKGHMLGANLAQARRGSRASLNSFASSLDSSQSAARPFGKLAELLTPGARGPRKRARGDAPHIPAGGGYGEGHESAPRSRSSGCCAGCCSLAALKRCFPVLEWLPAYKWRSNFLADLTAGLAVAVLNISTSLSAAVVAETDLGVAFRSSIVNTLVYALLCSSRHTSFGSWSIMSQMLLDSVRRALSDELILSRINLGPQASWSADEYETWHMNIIIMYTFLIGLVQLAAGLLGLGNLLASFIPEALCSSMIAATAFTMAIGQLANMCGTSNKILWAAEKNATEELAWSLDLENSPLSITDLFAGLFRWIQQLALLAKHYEQINPVALGISIICVLLLALNQYYLQAKLRALLKRDNLFLPFEMGLLIMWILISYALDLRDTYRVATCGPILIDFDAPNLPNLRLFRELWFDSLATALISYTMVFIMARTYGNKLNYEIDNNQELVACGAGNLVGGLFDALPATASFSRTAGQVEAGGRTQMASLINCLALTLVAVFLGHHVAQLPICVMSATLFFGFARMMTRAREILNYWRICKVDFAIWLVTFVAILTLDLVTGFVYGFIFSILTMLYRAQNRRCYLLGTIGSTADVYVPLAKYPLARELDRIKIFQFCGPIHYVCADLFERLLRRKTRVNVTEILKHLDEQPQAESGRERAGKKQQVVPGNGKTSCALPLELPHTLAGQRRLPTHIILDFSMISFIDSAGIHTIKKIIGDFQRIGITVMLASLASHVAQVVKSEPSLWETHKDRFYVTLADAVHHALRDSHQASPVSSIGRDDGGGCGGGEGGNLRTSGQPPPPPPPPAAQGPPVLLYNK